MLRNCCCSCYDILHTQLNCFIPSMNKNGSDPKKQTRKKTSVPSSGKH